MGTESRLRLYVLLVALSATVLPGCSKRKAVVKISCACPGYSAQMADGDVVGPLLGRLLIDTNAEKVTGIGTDGRAEFYLFGRAGDDPAELLRSAEKVVSGRASQLRGVSRIDEARVLRPSEALPSVPVKQVYRARVVIDYEKAAAAGLTAEDAFKAVSAATGPATDSPEGVRRLASTTMPVEGKHVVLGDVAKVTLERVPDRVVRTVP